MGNMCKVQWGQLVTLHLSSAGAVWGLGSSASLLFLMSGTWAGKTQLEAKTARVPWAFFSLSLIKPRGLSSIVASDGWILYMAPQGP